MLSRWGLISNRFHKNATQEIGILCICIWWISPYSSEIRAKTSHRSPSCPGLSHYFLKISSNSFFSVHRTEIQLRNGSVFWRALFSLSLRCFFNSERFIPIPATDAITTTNQWFGIPVGWSEDGKRMSVSDREHCYLGPISCNSLPDSITSCMSI